MKAGWAGGPLGPRQFAGQPQEADRFFFDESQQNINPIHRETRETFSIIVPSMGNPDLLECLLESLHRTAHRPYEVCLGFDASVERLPRQRFAADVKSAFATTPGMSAAMNAAFSISTGEWIVWVCDDMVFLPGWDDFEFGLRRDRMLCFQLLEPFTSPHFPPPCWAGDSPATFDRYEAEREATRRCLATYQQGRTVPGFFFGSAVLHRSQWVQWPTWCDPYSCNDISWFHEMRPANPNVAFGRMLGNCLYHFVRGSVRSRPDLIPEGEQVWGAFLGRYGLTIQEAYDAINVRAEALW